MAETPTKKDVERDHLRTASDDGTRIGFTKVGSGSIPLVLVHGALASGESWMEVAEALAEHCTCYVMDRWGRGGSDDRAEYSIDREVEDISAVLQAAGPDAYLLGHSSGAIYALETALRSPIVGLILYEPPLHGFYGRFAEDVWEPLRVAAEEERFDDVVSVFLADEAELPDSEITALRETPLWDDMVALAPHSVREWAALIHERPPVERYRDVAVPTLLLAGSETTTHPSFATEDLKDTLLDARIALLEGQGHLANRMAPDSVAQAVKEFCLDRTERSK